MHEKFLKFIDRLDIEDNLLEAIVGGYTAIFQESINAWSSGTNPPFAPVNPTSEPMGSYANIMKQIPSSVGAVGGAGDNTRGANNQYQYGAALPGTHRDQKDETMNDWEDAPNFPKFTKRSSSFIDNKIKKAGEHIPNGVDNMFAPMNYRTNFHLGRYDVDTPRPPF